MMQAPGDEPRVLPGRDHRRQPVERGVGVVAAHALDERADRVVVAVAGPVVGQDALLGGRLDGLQVDGESARRRPRSIADGRLEDVEGRPGVAGADGDEVLAGRPAARLTRPP